MAVCNPIAEIKSGSLGATVFFRNKGGHCVRLRTTPVNPNTARQQATRQVLGTISAGWKLLTQAQRDAWEAYASTHEIKNSLGLDINIAGQNWYCRINSRLSDAGITLLTDPPTLGAPSGLSAMVVAYQDDTTISVAMTPSVIGTYECVQMLFTLANSMGSTPNKNQSRMVAYSGIAPTFPLVMTLPFAVASGLQSTFYAAVMNSEGILSAFQHDTAARG